LTSSSTTCERPMLSIWFYMRSCNLLFKFCS
jgi:hypothetical protein